MGFASKSARLKSFNPLRTIVTNTRRPMSRIRDMREQCDGKLDTRALLLLVELTIEFCDCPISTNNVTVGVSISRSSAHTRHIFLTLVCAEKLQLLRIGLRGYITLSRIHDNSRQRVKSFRHHAHLIIFLF